MKKKILLLMGLSSIGMIHAQVGINTEKPKTTLHVIPSKTDGSTAEGIIAPNLTRAQLIAKDARYGGDQQGAIVYVTIADGTVSPKTTKVTAPGYFYFDGAVWQPFSSAAVTVPNEPWFVQGSISQATNNSENIYQMGSISVGSNSAGSYKFQVTGNSNITGNSRVGSSTVAGNETVGGTLGVTGATTLSNTLAVSGATTIASTGSFTLGGNGAAAGKYLASDASGKATWTALPAAAVTTANNGLTMSGTTTQLGGTLIKATTVTGSATNTLTLNAPTIIPSTGTFTLGGNGAAVGKYLASDASGKATWTALPAAAVTTANNGLTMSGTTTQLGGALNKATTVTGSATNTLTLNAPTIIPSTGTFTLGGNGAAAGKYLASDANGKGTWTTLPVTATTEPWQVQGGTTVATTNAQNIFQTGSVAIGSNSAGTYKFQVTGASNITGNSRVASSTVVGAETVGGTLRVTGVATMANNLVVTGNTGLGITAPAQKLHVVGNEYVTGISKVGGTATLNTSAQLELGDNNKGFLPNRVALTSATVKAPVTNAVDGMMVYNTTSAASKGVLPGYYYWRTNTWVRLVDAIPATSVNLLNLRTQVSSTVGDVTTLATQGVVLPFGDLVGSGLYAITLPEDGSYAFNFRLYGHIKENGGNVKVAKTIVYYIGLLNNSVLSDAAEINVNVIPTPGINTVATYSVVLACDGKAGDKITFRLHHFSITPYPWALSAGSSNAYANRTSMVWWKL